MTKKKEPFWIGPGAEPLKTPPAVNPPDGTNTQRYELGPEETLIHVTYPPYWDIDTVKNLAAWADKMKASFARKKTKVICSTEEIKINVIRPRTVRVMITNCYIEEPDLILKLKEELKDVVNLEVVVNGCNILKKGGSK